jgi:CRISPR-associated protein Csm1
MKADVDNLGLSFGLGLGERLSIARFSFLSRMLNIFFSDYLVELIRKKYPDIYVVFAGGDDLFVVGPWDQIIRFAVSLRRAFSRFCAENIDITLSAGILIGRPRYPMRRAAEDIKNLLDKSKDYKANGQQKDAVSLLGKTLSWQKLEDLLTLGEKFDRAIEEKDRTRFSMAFLYRLLEYYKMYKRFIDKSDKRDISAGRYLSHAHYDIGRNIADSKADNAEELAMLRDIFAVGGKEKQLLEDLYIPLFYAANRNRKET